MFKEDQYGGVLGKTLTAQRILAICPWLWAFEQIWTEGIACETGSRHTLTEKMLCQALDRNDGHVDIMFYMENGGIRTVHRVPHDERFTPHTIGRMEPNPNADGKTIAERIVAEMLLPPDILMDRLEREVLYIPHIVIRTPGPVDRSSHYYIYSAEGPGTPNTVPIIIKCAGNFIPKRFRKATYVAAPA